jgi:hypothetical protein
MLHCTWNFGTSRKMQGMYVIDEMENYHVKMNKN